MVYVFYFSTNFISVHVQEYGSVPDPGKMLITPFGNPALAESSANLSAVSGVTYKMTQLINAMYKSTLSRE